ncbi:MAG: TetR/AcrR family transcriptional regulator [Chloroflexota bacterium]
MNENDLRVQRTRRLLQEALIELANREEYSQITIRDITKAAQVGYKTFFRHYDSKEALLKAIVEAFIAKFQQAAQPSDNPNAVKKNTLLALQLAKENSNMYRAILNSPSAAQLLQPAMVMAYQDGQQLLGHSTNANTLVGNHFANSMLGFLKWWLDNEDVYSAEEMVHYIDQLLIQPIEQFRLSQ